MKTSNENNIQEKQHPTSNETTSSITNPISNITSKKTTSNENNIQEKQHPTSNETTSSITNPISNITSKKSISGKNQWWIPQGDFATSSWRAIVLPFEVGTLTTNFFEEKKFFFGK